MVDMAKNKIIFMFPGQGAQESKMGMDAWQTYPKAKEIFSLASQIYGENLESLCFEKPFQDMQRTDHAQILIATVSIVFYELLKQNGIFPSVVLGHSAGELAALYASGAIDLPDVLRLVSIRGKAMYEAAVAKKGKMIAVLGLDIQTAQKLVEEQRKQHAEIGISNYNAPQEIVISGDEDAVSRIEKEIASKKMGRAVDLKQQGAWHSEHMRMAQEKFGLEFAKIPLRKPSVPIILNYNADYVDDPDTIRHHLVHLLTNPVQWYPSLCKLRSDSPQIFCEVGPNKILRGLLRKGYPSTSPYEVFSINNLEGLNAFVQKMTKTL